MSDDETDLSVAKEFQGQKLGKKLALEYFDKYPDRMYKTGGFTDAGKATYLAALREISSSVITNAGTSEGAKKGWLKRQRARPDLIADIKSGKAITKSEYKYMMKQLTAHMPTEEKYRTMKDAKNSNTIFNDKLTPDEKRYMVLKPISKITCGRKARNLIMF